MASSSSLPSVSEDPPSWTSFGNVRARWASDIRLEGMLGGIHAWMNLVSSREVKEAVAAVHANDDVIRQHEKTMGAADLHVLDADLGRTFDAFEADFPGANTEENRQLLRRILLCATNDTHCGYCQGLNFLGGAVLLASEAELQPTIHALKLKPRKRAAAIARYRPALALCIVRRLLRQHGFAALYARALIPVFKSQENGTETAEDAPVAMGDTETTGDAPVTVGDTEAAEEDGAGVAAASPGHSAESSSGAGAGAGAGAGVETFANLPVVESEDTVDSVPSEQNRATLSPLQVMSSLFVRMLELHVPLVAEHMADSGISAELLAVKWFTTCFARALRVRGTLMAVDAILAGVPNVLLRLAAGLLMSLQDRILRMTQDDLMTKLPAAVLEVDVATAWENALRLPASLIQGEECGEPAPWEVGMFRHHSLKGQLAKSGKSEHWITFSDPSDAAAPSNGSSRAKAPAPASAASRSSSASSSASHEAETEEEKARRAKLRRAFRRAFIKAAAVYRFRATFSSEDIAAIVDAMHKGNPLAKGPPSGVAIASAAHRPSRGLVMDALLAMHAGTMPSHEQLRLFLDPSGRVVARPSEAAELLGDGEPAAEAGHGEQRDGLLADTGAVNLDERREKARGAGCPAWALDACDPREWGVETAREGVWRRWAEVSLTGVLVEDGVGWYFIRVQLPEALYASVTKHRFSHFDKLLRTLRAEDAMAELAETIAAMGLEWPADVPADLSLVDNPGGGSASRASRESPWGEAALDAVPAEAVAHTQSVSALVQSPTPSRSTSHRLSLSAGAEAARGGGSDGSDSVLGGLSVAGNHSVIAGAGGGGDGGCPSPLPNLPPKTWFGMSPLRRSFLMHRGKQLRSMVQRLLDTPFVAKHPAVTRFFGIEWSAVHARTKLPKPVKQELWRSPRWCWTEDISAMQQALHDLKHDTTLSIVTISKALRLLQHRIHDCVARPERPSMPAVARRKPSRLHGSNNSMATPTTPRDSLGPSSTHHSPLSQQRRPVRRASTFTERMLGRPVMAAGVVAGAPSKEASSRLASPAAADRGILHT